MKTKNGNNWYVDDLRCYTDEFKEEIILDLLERIENDPEIKKQLEEQI